LKYLSKYSIFSNIFYKNSSTYALSNGTFCQVLDIFSDFNLTKITLPSKQTKILSSWCFVITGRNAKSEYKFNRIGKAGVGILVGKKPHVRGVAKNPVDHPHGGRTKTNQPEVSPWG
jgi:large subunit ribosomal protein L2